MRFYKKSKKFVIARRRAHIYKWLNLLPEPKRNLQRFGFVHLGGGGDENNVRNNLLRCGLTQQWCGEISRRSISFPFLRVQLKCYNIHRHGR